MCMTWKEFTLSPYSQRQAARVGEERRLEGKGSLMSVHQRTSKSYSEKHSLPCYMNKVLLGHKHEHIWEHEAIGRPLSRTVHFAGCREYSTSGSVVSGPSLRPFLAGVCARRLESVPATPARWQSWQRGTWNRACPQPDIRGLK